MADSNSKKAGIHPNMNIQTSPRGARKQSHAADLAFLLAIPECAERLSRPGVKLWDVMTSDFFGKTLKTELSLRAFTVFWDEPGPGSNDPPEIADVPSGALKGGAHNYSSPEKGPGEEPVPVLETVHALIALGPGVEGYPGVVHGGAVATILDEITGLLPIANRVRGAPGYSNVGFMTGRIVVGYRRPVPANLLLVTARLESFAAGKCKVTGEIRAFGGSDGGENSPVLATGETLWIAIKNGKQYNKGESKI